jgi:hypothetical protein
MKIVIALIVVVFLIGCSGHKENKEAVNFSKIIVIGDFPDAIKDCLTEELTSSPDVRVNVAGSPQIVVHAKIVRDANRLFATLTAKTSDGITATGYGEAQADFPIIGLMRTSTSQLAICLRNQELERLTTPAITHSWAAPGQVEKENTTNK